jgi:hypothetical protein
MLALLGACAVGDDDTQPPVGRDRDEVRIEDVDLIEQEDPNAALCALAAELPETDVCAQICDPEAFKAGLLESGMKSGICYQIRCNLSVDVSATVGVCIP